MKIAILGSGPAGLLAAYACRMAGHIVTIYSKSHEPSVITGAQYIHERIPGLMPEQPDGIVEFHKVGTAEGYAQKVYGTPFAHTSWDIFPVGQRPMWSMQSVYEKLHREWNESINTRDIDEEFLDYLERKRDVFPLVISSIPCPIICQKKEHQFPSVNVTYETHNFSNSQLGEHYIYYSGSENDLWYRSSFVSGHGWFEYGKSIPNLSYAGGERRDLRAGIKPLDTNCDCRPRMIRVGRFGQWRKGVLVHHSYFKALDGLEVSSRPLHVPTKR